ncbi:MAG: hypothetical protein EXR86_13665 [Gammaproteobacteria bacterium]|nr:hypothetical protein [Gammaproteobacteria bacterium]
MNLGFLYAQGQGVDQDLEKAYAWFYIAGQLNHPLAADNLALIAAQIDTEGQQAGLAMGLSLLEEIQAKRSLASSH